MQQAVNKSNSYTFIFNCIKPYKHGYINAGVDNTSELNLCNPLITCSADPNLIVIKP